MADMEQSVEYMICAFIAIGIIVVAGWVVFTKTGVASHIGMTEEDLKKVVPEDQYAGTMSSMEKSSILFWLIAFIVAFGGLLALYIAITESLEWTT
jgi:H+/Cl- antiporter ClcA